MSFPIEEFSNGRGYFPLLDVLSGLGGWPILGKRSVYNETTYSWKTAFVYMYTIVGKIYQITGYIFLHSFKRIRIHY